MLISIGKPFYNLWLKLPYSWRRRLVVAGVVWIVVRLFITAFGFDLLLFWLIAAFAAAYVLAEIGLRKADGAETWTYGMLTGQLQGIITGALIPVVIESWTRYFASQTQDELITASIVTALFVYMVLFLKKSFSLALRSQVKDRRKLRASR